MAKDGDKKRRLVSKKDRSGEDNAPPKMSSSQRIGAGWTAMAMMFAAVVTAATFAVSGTDGNFAFDDNFAIVNNRDVTSPDASLADLWKHDFWGQNISKPDSHKSFRPLTTLTFRWDWQRKGGPGGDASGDPRSFHIVNIAMHSLVAALVVPVSLTLFPSGVSVEDGAEARGAGRSKHGILQLCTATAAAVLFGLHPVHVEAVTGLVGRAEMLSAIFFCSAFLAYARSIEALRPVDGTVTTLWSIVAGVWLGIFAVAFIAAVLSKETGFTVLGVAAVQEILAWWSGEGGGKRWRVVRGTMITSLAALYLIGRKIVTVSFTLHNYRFLENPIAYTKGLTRVLTTLHLHAFYAEFLILPFPLCADWSFDAVPLVERLTDPRNIRTIIFYATVATTFVGGLGWGMGQRGRNGSSGRCSPVSSPGTVLCVAWGGAAFLPVANIFFPVGTMVGERLMYLPSLPFCVLAGRLLRSAWERAERRSPSKQSGKTVAVAIAVAVVVTCALLTNAQNRVWRSEEDLFRHARRYCSGSAKVHYNMGVLHRREKDYSKALQEFDQALAILPDYCEVHWFRGLTRYELAIAAHGSAEQKKIIERGMFAGPPAREHDNSWLAEIDEAVQCKYTAQQASPMMESLLSTMMRSGHPGAVNSTLQVFLGNLMFTHGHYDKACEHWAVAGAVEGQPLGARFRSAIRRNAARVLEAVEGGCVCTELTCPSKDKDCTHWALVASAFLSGQSSKGMVLVRQGLRGWGGDSGGSGEGVLIAARLSKLLYLEDVMTNPERASGLLRTMVSLDKANADYVVGLAGQLADMGDLRGAEDVVKDGLRRTGADPRLQRWASRLGMNLSGRAGQVGGSKRGGGQEGRCGGDGASEPGGGRDRSMGNDFRSSRRRRVGRRGQEEESPKVHRPIG